jgi:site-specific DNA recombinase
MILRGGAPERLNEHMVQMEARKRKLEGIVAESRESAPLLHPEMAGYDRRQVESLHEALRAGPETERLKAADLLRSLIAAIVLTPDEEGTDHRRTGRPGGHSPHCVEREKPRRLTGGVFGE